MIKQSVTWIYSWLNTLNLGVSVRSNHGSLYILDRPRMPKRVYSKYIVRVVAGHAQAKPNKIYNALFPRPFCGVLVL